MTSNNEEKAHAMLNRWVAMKKEINSRFKDKRPKSSYECNNLQECERWRNQVIKEITKKVADIQNASLGEYKIREINDEINRLFKEKSHWEQRIKDLGGPDYKKLAPKAVDAEGFELPGSGGYRYWGAAKDLPGVRELFAKEIPHAPKKSRMDLYKNINFEYYGCNKNDEELINQEKEAEELLLQEYLLQLQETEYENARKRQRLSSDDNTLLMKETYIIKRENFNEEEFFRFRMLHTPDGQNINLINSKHNDEEIEKLILEKKKKQLIKLLNLDEVENLIHQNEEILKDNKVVLDNLQSNLIENEI